MPDPTPDRHASEEWRPIPGCPLYEVSDIGRVRSLLGVGERILRQHSRGGYPGVTLAHPITCTRTIHTLVALAFIGPRPTSMHVCHADGRPENNTLGNLRYDTAAANAADRERHGRTSKGERHPAAKLTAAGVLEIRRRHSVGESARRLAREFGVALATLQRACAGKTWRHVPTPPAPGRKAKRVAHPGAARSAATHPAQQEAARAR